MARWLLCYSGLFAKADVSAARFHGRERLGEGEVRELRICKGDVALELLKVRLFLYINRFAPNQRDITTKQTPSVVLRLLPLIEQ